MCPSLKPLKWYKNLATRKGRLEAGAFLIEGNRAVSQVIAGHPGEVLEILRTEETQAPYNDYPSRVLTGSQFKTISGAATPQGILAVVKTPPDIYSGRLPYSPGNRILLLEDIQDPGNAGTLVRTAAAFGYDGIIMTENGADPLSPKCVQSTAGSVLSVWIRRTAGYLDLVDNLREKEYTLAAAVLDGKDDPHLLARNDRMVLALGNEAAGLSPEITGRADYRAGISIEREKAESLNVAACGAIFMYLSAGKKPGAGN